MNSTFVGGAHVYSNGIRQHYLRYGTSGPSLVIVPGITSPAITWGFIGERLGRHFQVTILDVRGRGLSSGGDELDYGINALAGDLASLIRDLNLEGCTLLGHSMGARIITRAIAQYGAEPGRVVLVDPPVSGPGRREYPSKLPWYMDSIRDARRGMSAGDMKAYCPSWTEEQRALRAEWLHTCNAGAVLRAFNDFHDDDFHRDLPSMTQPAHLIVAGKGGVIQTEDVAEISSLCPGIGIHHVDQAGHMIPWDDEAGFYTAVSECLDVDLSAITTEAER